MVTAWEERVLALAGITQAVAAVHQLAHEGALRVPEVATPLYHSVLEVNPASTEAVYDGREKLNLGVRLLLEQIGATKNKNVEITRYVVSIIALARRYQSQPKAVTELGQRIQQLQRQRDGFGFDEDTIIAGMASAYSDILSPLMRPIRVSGKPAHLKSTHVQNQICALLLAAVRSACLWRDVGGKRRHFIFS
ncbi:lysogenization regulator HflD, partial [Thalassospira xiamenensis]